MRHETYTQIAVVEGENPQEFEQKFNGTVRELTARGCKVDKSGISIKAEVLRAVIPYEVTESYMDCIADEFHAEGLYFFCRNCPYLEAPADKRVKHCNCAYAEYGHTHKDHEACELFYKLMKQNRIRPIPD